MDTRIEALLFFKGEPVSIEDLAKILSVSVSEIELGLTVLGNRLTGGVRLMRQNNQMMLATAPEHTQFIESIIKEELSKDLGKAGAETLATVLYMGPITRARIDHVRGVNSTFILRNLTARGLVEKIPNPSDSRSMLYRPTLTLLSYLGVAVKEDLPDYQEIRRDVGLFERREDINEEKEALSSDIETDMSEMSDQQGVTDNGDEMEYGTHDSKDHG